MNRSLKLAPVVALSVLLAACASDTTDDPIAHDEGATIDSNASAFTLAAYSSSDVPMTGAGNPGFAGVDAAIQKLMAERCIGAAVIGVAKDGAVIHNRGFGYKKGPPNAKCGTAADPFIGGTKMGPTDPIRIGSNAKAILASVFRKEIKKALSAARGGKAVTDAEIEALTLLDNGELNLVAPRVREAMLAGFSNGGQIGEIANEPCIPKAWEKVTLGQLLTHRAGLGSTDMAYDEMSDIRGLNSVLKLVQQQNASGAPLQARAALKNEHGQNAYFVPRATLEELMVAQGDRCFAYTPGTKTNYSNAGFTLLTYVLEHVTGRSFAAPNGYPAEHGTSLLAEFLNDELGFSDGIEHSHTALGTRDVAEPGYRDWNGVTYYPKMNDDKRPWCVLSAGKCDFAKFEAGESRFAWDWTEGPVDQTYRSNSVAPGVGALAVEAPQMLKWMARYTVDSPYGGERINDKSAHDHYGGLGGTASWVYQYNGSTVQYPGFGKNADGSTNFEIAKRRPGSCVIPKGVDVIFSINQTGDANCTEANGCSVCADEGCTKMKNAYSAGYYDGLVKQALCGVDWSTGPQ